MSVIYLVRHGESVYNLEGRIQGQQDPHLSETGLHQAKALARRFSSHGFEAIYSSDLSRASETARVIGEELGLSVVTTPLLRESRLGVIEGLTKEEMERQYPAAEHGWRQDPLNHRPPGAESILDIIRRARTFLKQIDEKHKGRSQILAVGHIGSIRAIILAALDLPERIYQALRISNASVSVIRLDDMPRLTLLNDICHLEHSVGSAEEF